MRPLVRLCEIIGIAIASYFCIALVLAVVMRYVFNRSLGWIDELSSILLAWVMFVVGAIGFNERVHIAAEGFVDRLPLKLRRAVAIGVQVVIAAFFAIVGYYGWFVAKADMFFAMATIPLSRGIFLFVIPAAAFVVVLICVNNIIKLYYGAAPVPPAAHSEQDALI